jgi:hypothetical protein
MLSYGTCVFKQYLVPNLLKYYNCKYLKVFLHHSLHENDGEGLYY